MSDGMRDSRLLGEIANRIEDAAWSLRDAIRESSHRGWQIDVLAHANPILSGTAYALRERGNQLISDGQVRVGVAVILTNARGEVLLGLRRGDHGGGTWSFPGGHVEHREQPLAAALREVREETGCIARDLRVHARCPYVSTVFDSGKHYLTLYFIGQLDDEPRVEEPDKCVEWRWFLHLPTPLFPAIRPDLLFPLPEVPR